MKTASVEPAAVTPKLAVPSPSNTPCAVNEPAPVPPCGTVTAEFEVSTVAEAFGKVNVLSEVAGPVTAKNPFPVPPLAPGRMPVTFVVRSIVALVMSALTIRLEVTVCVLPAKCATPTPGAVATTQVEQESVFVESDSGLLNVAVIWESV